MNNTLTFIENGRRAVVRSPAGERLLDAIRRSGLHVHAPCGGKGICGKCVVDVSGIGRVKSCSFYPDRDLLVTIPGPSAMEILTESFWPEREPVPDILPAGDYHDLGLAVDVGTTTVVVFLEDLRNHRNMGTRSLPNPQQAYGADVISRINFCRENPDGLEKLHHAIVKAIGEAGGELCRQADVKADRIARIIIAGNPTMLHLIRGVDPESLAIYPFNAVFLDEQNLPGREAGFVEFPESRVELLPSVSSYVGADITAGFAAIDWNSNGGYRLFLDIGTNGEIVLWNDKQILTCATAAGPAFEGARISCGMAGVDGAVSTVNTDGTFETIGNTLPRGLCGSGLVDAVAVLLERGEVDQAGYLADEAVVIRTDDGHRTTHVCLTPQDIREVQLAKGAIAAGVEVLLLEAGIRHEEVKQVFLGGGFGYAMHDWSAIRIGLIPEGLGTKLIRAGNTAGLGARLWLHSEEFRNHTRELTARMRYIDLSGHESFNDHFVMNMGF